MTLTQLLFWIGAADAIVIVVLGVIAAFLVVFDLHAGFFWDRVAPAVGYLVGTSFAAGIVIAVTRWLTGIS